MKQKQAKRTAQNHLIIKSLQSQTPDFLRKKYKIPKGTEAEKAYLKFLETITERKTHLFWFSKILALKS